MPHPCQPQRVCSTRDDPSACRIGLDRITFKFPVFPFALQHIANNKTPFTCSLSVASETLLSHPNAAPAHLDSDKRSSIQTSPRMSFLARRAVAATPRAARAFSTTPSRPLAKITIVGNLVQTPELQATSTGREVLKYAVASNTGRGENTRTSYFRVSSFEAEGPRRDYFQTLPKGSVAYPLELFPRS